jgi:hypothetical protein
MTSSSRQSSVAVDAAPGARAGRPAIALSSIIANIRGCSGDPAWRGRHFHHLSAEMAV